MDDFGILFKVCCSIKIVCSRAKNRVTYSFPDSTVTWVFYSQVACVLKVMRFHLYYKVSIVTAGVDSIDPVIPNQANIFILDSPISMFY